MRPPHRAGRVDHKADRKGQRGQCARSRSAAPLSRSTMAKAGLPASLLKGRAKATIGRLSATGSAAAATTGASPICGSRLRPRPRRRGQARRRGQRCGARVFSRGQGAHLGQAGPPRPAAAVGLAGLPGPGPARSAPGRCRGAPRRRASAGFRWRPRGAAGGNCAAAGARHRRRWPRAAMPGGAAAVARHRSAPQPAAAGAAAGACGVDGRICGTGPAAARARLRRPVCREAGGVLSAAALVSAPAGCGFSARLRDCSRGPGRRLSSLGSVRRLRPLAAVPRRRGCGSFGGVAGAGSAAAAGASGAAGAAASHCRRFDRRGRLGCRWCGHLHGGVRCCHDQNRPGLAPVATQRPSPTPQRRRPRRSQSRNSGSIPPPPYFRATCP